MATVDTLRNDLIDKLLTISNKEYLLALNQLVEKSAVNNDVVGLTEDQILMLQLSDRDIEAGRIISHEQLDKNDLQWLKEK
ncbi:hypothetical protein HDF18_15685 [Mucilaginibacter sp. X5P1]|uniref:hypothetical protein n=1 Tax=Mucilaginibacter sp. X5P1 TaxID=2723088 RepID=UPI00161C3300|nr:hypothetical protein [Mucilaginibacter sp. X5P1]MBB6139062.1 hypothetical protein [Mucilaginibacter sp. X5P1]